MAVEIRQIVNEISSFLEVLYKEDDLKNFSKFTDKHKKQSPEVFLSEDVLKNFARFTDKHFCQIVLFYKVAGWKPEIVRGSHRKYSVN